MRTRTFWVCRLLILSLLWAGFEAAFALSFNRYHSYAESEGYLSKIVQEYQDLADLKVIGHSHLGRPLTMLRLKGPEMSNNSGLINVYINGSHHGDEKVSTEVALAVIALLTSQYHDPRIKELYKQFVFYIQPIVNPDGHFENTREGATGIDLNRDYLPSREGFRAEETRFVRDFLQKNPLSAAIALHSGTEAVLWPRGSHSTPPYDEGLFQLLSKKIAYAMGFTRFMQSFYDYPTRGEFIDYAYDKFGILAVTLEVSEEHSPPNHRLPQIVTRGVHGVMAFIEGLDQQRKTVGSTKRVLFNGDQSL